MAYYICETDDKMNSKTIKITQTNTELLNIVIQLISDKYNFETLEGVGKNIILINSYFSIGYYLLFNKNVELIHKNSPTKITTLFTWELLPYVSTDELIPPEIQITSSI